MSNLMIGTAGTPEMLEGNMAARMSVTDHIRQSDIDHLFVADHISFHTGLGMDGIVNAATLAAMMPETTIVIGVYLLALRHPVPVARQLSSLSLSAPGRIVLGVGVGGEDRHEMEICGVNPATRGRQTNHALAALHQLMKGEPASYHCDYFEFESALIKPTPKPEIPIIVGGRSDGAIRRAALYGDGWLGLWSSPERFRVVVEEISTIAASEGRQVDSWQHGLQVWVGFDENEQSARRYVATGMEEMYKVPFEKFEKYSPYGSPERVAEFLAPYIEAGARMFNIAPRAASDLAGIEAVSEVAAILKKTYPDLTYPGL
ncbi:MAG: LLM class flavin-dependent oxidoreductase [Gammaproteobacteria bacterium]|nr:LLM class flavin-dependent oxidoreductase [Gammaproteobacteria bacterium]